MINENTVVAAPELPIDRPNAALEFTGLNMCRDRTALEVATI
eukprot:CAMPEP_0182448694 /NCGR_PEP_ID=MMETSP1172-20130603/28807_1 /TAXON_ID=708627 /ORGANISM="Timspurckia oligopyrenoides, Strain CCMP3278" /LENGTH=41 /DNA_ID= /DNA_START= /DNA_END= /DNA_ORIENTATION=